MNKSCLLILVFAFFTNACLSVGGETNPEANGKDSKNNDGTRSGAIGGSSSGAIGGSSSGSSSGSASGSTSSSSGTFVTSLTCVSSPDESFPEQNTTCFGIQTCGDLGVCVLCLKPCIGESFIDCDPKEIPHYEATETSCNDGHDNDCDGKTDCIDEDCISNEECKKGCEFDDPDLTDEAIVNFKSNQADGKVILQYTFDEENANDSSGNSFHGEEHNVTYTQGQFGKAAQFNGTNSYIEVPWKGRIQDFSGKSFTFEVWFKTKGNDFVPQDGMFRPLYSDSQAFIGNNFDHGAIVGIVHGDNGKISFAANAPSKASYHTNDVEPTNYSGTYPDNILDDQWHHVAGVKDVTLGQARVYLDGKCFVNIEPKQGVDSITPDAAYYIGATHISLNSDSEDISHYKGLIDEVIISDYAKSTEEIQQYYFGKISVISSSQNFHQCLHHFITKSHEICGLIIQIRKIHFPFQLKFLIKKSSIIQFIIRKTHD